MRTPLLDADLKPSPTPKSTHELGQYSPTTQRRQDATIETTPELNFSLDQLNLPAWPHRSVLFQAGSESSATEADNPAYLDDYCRLIHELRQKPAASGSEVVPAATALVIGLIADEVYIKTSLEFSSKLSVQIETLLGAIGANSFVNIYYLYMSLIAIKLAGTHGIHFNKTCKAHYEEVLRAFKSLTHEKSSVKRLLFILTKLGIALVSAYPFYAVNREKMLAKQPAWLFKEFFPLATLLAFTGLHYNGVEVFFLFGPAAMALLANTRIYQAIASSDELALAQLLTDTSPNLLQTLNAVQPTDPLSETRSRRAFDKVLKGSAEQLKAAYVKQLSTVRFEIITLLRSEAGRTKLATLSQHITPELDNTATPNMHNNLKTELTALFTLLSQVQALAANSPAVHPALRNLLSAIKAFIKYVVFPCGMTISLIGYERESHAASASIPVMTSAIAQEIKGGLAMSPLYLLALYSAMQTADNLWESCATFFYALLYERSSLPHAMKEAAFTSVSMAQNWPAILLCSTLMLPIGWWSAGPSEDLIQDTLPPEWAARAVIITQIFTFVFNYRPVPLVTSGVAQSVRASYGSDAQKGEIRLINFIDDLIKLANAQDPMVFVHMVDEIIQQYRSPANIAEEAPSSSTAPPAPDAIKAVLRLLFGTEATKDILPKQGELGESLVDAIPKLCQIDSKIQAAAAEATQTPWRCYP